MSSPWSSPASGTQSSLHSPIEGTGTYWRGHDDESCDVELVSHDDKHFLVKSCYIHAHSTLLSDMLSSAVLGATEHTPADASNRATLTFSDENFENGKTIACVLDMLTGRNLKPRLSRPGDCHRIYKVLEFMRKWECKFATSHVIAYVSAMVREKNPVLDHPGRLLQAAAMLDDGDFAFTIVASTGHLATPSHGDLHLDPEFRKKPDSSYLDPRAMSVELKKALPFAYYEALG